MLNKMRDNSYKTLMDCLIDSMESYLVQEGYTKKEDINEIFEDS